MQATLIYNPQAGNTSHLQPEQILEALGQVGYEPAYSPTSTEEDLDQALAKAKDLIVVAGGDGSIRSVATRLLDREVRITPLPMGTANNICRFLGLRGKPIDILTGLADPVERDIDIGCANTPQGPKYFLEAMGIGVFADALEKYNPEDGKSVRRGLKTLWETLNDYQPKFFHLNVDGQDFSGSYFLCEVMNTPTMGFHYRLAPDAQVDDGQFDLVLIHANQREGYLKFMRAVLTGTLEHLPEVSIQRGRKLELAWRGFSVHFDGEFVAGLDGIQKSGQPSQAEDPDLLDVEKPFVSVEMTSQAIHFLVPKGSIPEPPEATFL
jgi:diacylglycerol kinase (ATP)